MEKRTLYALLAVIALGGIAFAVLRSPEKGQRQGPPPRPIAEIKANDIVLDAKTISFSGQTSVETVGGQVNSTATGTHTVKGALVKIN